MQTQSEAENLEAPWKVIGMNSCSKMEVAEVRYLQLKNPFKKNAASAHVGVSYSAFDCILAPSLLNGASNLQGTFSPQFAGQHPNCL